MAIQDRIIQIMQNYGLNSLQFANKLGVQPSNISHILSGRNKPSLDFITKILKNFPDIDYKWLVLNQGSMLSLESQTVKNKNNETNLPKEENSLQNRPQQEQNKITAEVNNMMVEENQTTIDNNLATKGENNVKPTVDSTMFGENKTVADIGNTLLDENKTEANIGNTLLNENKTVEEVNNTLFVENKPKMEEKPKEQQPNLFSVFQTIEPKQQLKTEIVQKEEPQTLQQKNKVRNIEKVIVFYDDNTYKEIL
ncbi:MAG: helix-turn-helix transcriptional regulator [Bacteroidales bacterium]|nr:helix-turn-helix transcriptional regulator [Bacteroidales bacterium]